jgi:hypothetical protein
MMAFAHYDRDGDLDAYLVTNHQPPAEEFEYQLEYDRFGAPRVPERYQTANANRLPIYKPIKFTRSPNRPLQLLNRHRSPRGKSLRCSPDRRFCRRLRAVSGRSTTWRVSRCYLAIPRRSAPA